MSESKAKARRTASTPPGTPIEIDRSALHRLFAKRITAEAAANLANQVQGAAKAAIEQYNTDEATLLTAYGLDPATPCSIDWVAGTITVQPPKPTEPAA